MNTGDLAIVNNEISEWFSNIGKIIEVFEDSNNFFFYKLWFKEPVAGYSVFRSNEIEFIASDTAV